jgi:glyoxylase-like metal-dependent hydrolase (beta-lactamase superfamily II)
MKHIVALMLLALFVGRTEAAENMNTTDPIKRGIPVTEFPRTKQLAPGIYSFEALRASGEPNNGQMTTVSLFVVGKNSVLLADGQGTVPDTEALLAAIRKTTPLPLKYVVVCSDHGDHTNGNETIKAAFPDAVFIATPASQAAMEKSKVVPTELVTDHRSLDLGDMKVDILNLGRSHTGGDLSVFVPAPKILFMSETYLHRVFPAMRSAYPTEWLATLKKAQDMNASWYIAGHGFVDEPAVMKAELEEYRKAVAYVIGEAKRLHDAKVPCLPPAKDAKDPAESCPAAQQANWGPYAEWDGHTQQARVALLKVYEELDGKLK